MLPGSSTSGLEVGGAIAAFGSVTLNITGSTFDYNAAISMSQNALVLGGAIYTHQLRPVPDRHI